MKQEIDFVKCNPTQNTTILVKTNHSAEEHKHIAHKIMSYDSVYAEQVGFIQKPNKHEAAAHLQMAGGEFCGNACMALAAFIASEKGIHPNDLLKIVLETSGTDQFVTCQVKKNNEEYFRYIALLIDPFSEPNQDGKYFDFSAVPIPSMFVNREGYWDIPRMPKEDYYRIKIIQGIAKYVYSSCPTLDKFISIYERKIENAAQSLKGELLSDAFLVQSFEQDLKMICSEIAKNMGSKSMN